MQAVLRESGLRSNLSFPKSQSNVPGLAADNPWADQGRKKSESLSGIEAPFHSIPRTLVYNLCQ